MYLTLYIIPLSVAIVELAVVRSRPKMSKFQNLEFWAEKNHEKKK